MRDSMAENTKVAYYPGCTLFEKARQLDDCTRTVLKTLGVDLEEMPVWTCCGSVFPLATDSVMGLVAPVRNLAYARRTAPTVITACDGCYNVLKRTNKVIVEDDEIREKINLFLEEDIEEPYNGEEEVFHVLDYIRDRVGFDVVKEKVVRSLEGLQVSPYYGCLMLRPKAEMQVDDTEEPTIMKDLLEALGCEIIDSPYKTECCSAYLSVSQPDVATKRCHDIVDWPSRHGATVLVVSCPLCQFNLDERQQEVPKTYHEFAQVPVVYFEQLMGYALGMDIKDCAFEDHFIDPVPVLEGVKVSV